MPRPKIRTSAAVAPARSYFLSTIFASSSSFAYEVEYLGETLETAEGGIRVCTEGKRSEDPPLRQRSGVRLRTLREEERERRALAGCAPRPDLTSVGLGDLARYGEPEAGAAVGVGGVRPVEALEDEG